MTLQQYKAERKCDNDAIFFICTLKWWKKEVKFSEWGIISLNINEKQHDLELYQSVWLCLLCSFLRVSVQQICLSFVLTFDTKTDPT